MNRVSYDLGIDLGTAYTAAAVHRDGRADVVTLGDRAASIPSAIFLKEDETILTGDAASRRATSEPDRIAREFKRRLGDPTPILLAGTPYSAEALMAKLLRWVVDKVTELEGGPPARVTVTHPANWGPYKKDLLDQAIRLADITDATTISEPEAAAIYYASNARVEAGSIVAVYDLGGGTFDAAVLRKTDDGWEILGQPEGIERLGGIDFDQAVFSHVRSALDGKIEELDLDDRAAMAAVARLRADCVVAKEALSSDTDATVPVLLPNVSTEVRINRAELEALIRPTLQDTIGALRRALRSAGVEADDVSAVLLVGGSSRIPLVAQLVSAELGRPVAVDAHPKHAVALGAALTAAGARSGREPVLDEHRFPPRTEVAAPIAPPAAPAPPAPKKRSPLVPVIAALALVAAAAGAWFLLGGDDDGGEDETASSTTTTSAAGASDPVLIERVERRALGTGERYFVMVDAPRGAEIRVFWDTIDPEDGIVWVASNDGVNTVDHRFFDVAEQPDDATEICAAIGADGTVDCVGLPTEVVTVGTPPTTTPGATPTQPVGLIGMDRIVLDGDTYVIEWTQNTAGLESVNAHLHFYWAGENVAPVRATSSAADPIPWAEFGDVPGSIKGIVDENGKGSSRDEAFAVSAKPAGANRICVVAATGEHAMVDANGDSRPDGFGCQPLPA